MKNKIVIRLLAFTLAAGVCAPQMHVTALASETAVSMGETGKLDAAALKDGEYSVEISLWNAANPSQNSMADNAVRHQASLIVRDGSYYLQTEFQGMTIQGLGSGYLKSLSYWDGSGWKPATVLSSYENMKDAYNDSDKDGTPDYLYPKKIESPLINKKKGDRDGYIRWQVYVPIMAAINPVSGTQEVLLKVDWNSLKPVHINEDKSGTQDGEVQTGTKVSRIDKANTWGSFSGLDFPDISKYSSNKNDVKYATAIKRVSVNGVDYNRYYDVSDDDAKIPYSWEASAYGLRIYEGAVKEGKNTVVIKADGYKDTVIQFSKEGNKYTLITKDDMDETENSGKETAEDSKLKDGVYTLSFTAKQDGKDETSMLQGSFDPKVKLTVENGRMKISMLNTALVWALVDFTMESEGKYPGSAQQYIGKADASGKYSLQEFTIPIKDLSVMHKGAVLVTAMGGQLSDKGNYDKYAKLDLSFGKEIQKGWDGYQYEIDNPAGVDGNAKLIEALVKKGYDTDKDGKISKEELQAISGTLDLSYQNLTDIRLLKDLSDKVTAINLTGNKIETLPEGMLDHVVNLEQFFAGGNLISEIPGGFFKNNGKVNWINLSSNLIRSVDKEDLTGLSSVKELDLGNNAIANMDEMAFEGLKSLETLALNGNKLSFLADGTFRHLTKVSFLNLEENRLTKLPSSIGKMKKLEWLTAAKNQILSLDGINFTGLSVLKKVDLGFNRITEIKAGTFASNKEISEVSLYNNQLTNFSADVLPDGISMSKLDLQMNLLQSVDDKVKTLVGNGKIYPQLESLKLKLEAEGRSLKWSQAISVLDLLYWYDATNSSHEEEISTVEAYDKMLKSQGVTGNDIASFMDQKGYDWKIRTEVQKKDSNGIFRTVSEKSENDMEDHVNGMFLPEEDGTYRIVKTLYASTFGNPDYKFAAVSNEVMIASDDDHTDQDQAGDHTNENRKDGNTDNEKTAAGHESGGNNHFSGNGTLNTNSKNKSNLKQSILERKNKTVQTGDTSNVLLWGMAVAGSALAAGIVTWKKKFGAKAKK